MAEKLEFIASAEGFDKVEQSFTKVAKGLDKVKKESAGVAPAMEKIKSSLPVAELEKATATAAKLAPVLNKIPPALDNIGKASKRTSTELARTALDANKLDSSLKKAAVGATSANFALTNTGRVLQDLPFGFVGIQNNLNPLLESFQRLRVETGSSRAALKALGSSLIGGGGIGFALSAISGIVLIAQNGFMSFGRKAKEAKESVEDFNKTLRDAEAGALATGQSLQTWVAIARDQTQSINTRNEALERANKILGDHGEKLTLVNIETAAVTAQIEKFTQATIQQTLATKFADRAADFIIKQRDASKEYAIELAKLNELKKKSQTFENAQGVTVLTDAGKAAAKQARKVAEVAQAYKDVTKELRGVTGELFNAQLASAKLFGSLDGADKLTGIIEKLKKQIKDLEDIQPKLLNEADITKNVAAIKTLKDELDRLLGIEKASAKAKETIRDVIAEMRKEISLLNKEEVLFNTDNAEKRVNAFLGTIKTLVTKFKVPENSGLINSLLDEAKIAKLGFLVDKAFIKLGVGAMKAFKSGIDTQLPQVVNQFQQSIEDAFDKIKAPNAATIQVPMKIEPVVNLDGVNFNDLDRARDTAYLKALGIGKGIQDGLNISIDGLRFPELKALRASLEERLKQLNAGIDSIIASTISNIASSIAESLGAIISGESASVGQIFEKFLNVMAQGLKAIGKALVEYGIAKTVISKLNISGPAAIAIGLGLQIFAAALQNSLKLPQFATGVRNFDGGYARVGEHGAETVFLPRGSSVIPAGQTSMMGGQHITVGGYVDIDGQKLRVVLNRADASNNRNF